MNFLRKLSLLFLSMLIFASCEEEGGDPTPNPSPKPSIVLQEIRYNQNDRFEITNQGSTTIDIAEWWVCSRLDYAQLTSLTVEEGSLNLAAGASVILSGFSLNDQEADVALYSTNAFSSSDAIVDFVQYGSAGNGRESVAATAGIWTAGQFVPDVADGSSIEYDGTGDSASDWIEQNTPSLGDAPTPTPAVVEIRFTLIDYVQEKVTLKNVGDDLVDMTNYQLCLGPNAYNVLSNYTSITGSLMLAAGDSVQIDLTSGSENVTALPDANGALGLFAEPLFASTSPEVILDFVQWGAANQNRVGQAVTAGRWDDANSFVQGAAPYTYLGDADDIGKSTWVDNTAIRMIQINTATDEVVLKNFDQVERDLTDYFFCTLAGVYPQLGNASEVQIINGDLSLSPNEEVTVKVLTSGGVVDVDGSIFLFSNNTLGFNNQSALVTRDFAQWGAGNGFRVENAVATNRWENVANFIAGDSPFTYTGDIDDIGSTFWEGTASTPPSNDLIIIKEVRFNGNDRIEIVNLNSSSLDISDWWFCTLFAYRQLSAMTVESGTLNIPAGGSVVLSGLALSDVADLGLYTTNSFASASAMVDFVQWGGGNNGRASVAVSAGIWPSADAFVPVGSIAAGNSIEFDGEGNAPSDWAINSTPTL